MARNNTRLGQRQGVYPNVWSQFLSSVRCFGIFSLSIVCCWVVVPIALARAENHEQSARHAYAGVSVIGAESVAAADPGEDERDIPLVGQSLFDSLFSIPGEGAINHQVPYPFSKVIARIENSLGLSINGDANVVKSVLIPLGRCINRSSAAPDYFAHPRIIIAADSEPRISDDGDFPFLKDKLFIGYQESANSMEVISYNDAAGRFEFQVVNGYSAETQPTVEYVERSRCLGCHQNSGPIFPLPNWSETDFNNKILKRLEEAGVISNRGKSSARRGQAVAIDGSTNRANLFFLSQKLWREICRSDLDHDSIRCRAGIFELILQHRFRKMSRTFVLSDRISRYLMPVSTSVIEQRWPGGIYTKSADIQNQDPFQFGNRAHLQSAVNLLQPRSNSIHWKLKDLFRTIAGLGQFVPMADLRRLDAKLFESVSSSGHALAKRRGVCDLHRSDKILLSETNDQTGDLAVDCRFQNGDIAESVRLIGDLFVRSGKVISLGGLSRIMLGNNTFITGLSHRGGEITSQDDQWTLQLTLYESNDELHAWLPGGGMYDQLSIQWPKTGVSDPLFQSPEKVIGEGTLSIFTEDGAISAAITRMIARADRGELELFSDKTFRARPLMNALIRELTAQ